MIANKNLFKRHIERVLTEKIGGTLGINVMANVLWLVKHAFKPFVWYVDYGFSGKLPDYSKDDWVYEVFVAIKL